MGKENKTTKRSLSWLFIRNFKIKKILLLILFLFINNNIQLSSKDNIDITQINLIAEEVARSIKYYDNQQNYYKGENEFEGYCADYAVLFALKTGANLVVQNQRKEIPDGVYRLVDNVSIDIKNEIKRRLVTNHRSGLIGPWDDARFPIIIYHPVTGFYSIELIKRKTIKTHFGFNMNGTKHVWNELNGVIIDVCYADTSNTPFIGIDTY